MVRWVSTNHIRSKFEVVLQMTMVRWVSTNGVNRVFCGPSGGGFCDKQKNTVGIRGVLFGYLFGQAKR